MYIKILQLFNKYINLNLISSFNFSFSQILNIFNTQYIEGEYIISCICNELCFQYFCCA